MLDALPYCKALGDATRLRLARILLDHELNVNELVGVMEMGQSRISRHLKILADAGLVTHRRDGLWVFYRVTEEGVGRDMLEALHGLFPDDDATAEDIVAAERSMQERRRATTQFFDAISDKWDQLSREVLGGLDLANAIDERLPQCGAAVDLGCGTGRLLRILQRKAQFVIGVDSSPNMLEAARAQLLADGAPVSLRLGALEHLPVLDGEADCVVTSLVLHHLDQPERGVAEAARVLKLGGHFLVADYDKHAHEAMRSRYGDRWLGFSAEELRGWLSQHGFRILEEAVIPVEHGLAVRITKTQKHA